MTGFRYLIPPEALRPLEPDEKLTSEILRAGQKRKVNLVNESGLYALIFRSNKETARKFRQWVTKEVLPAIRKKGSYGIDRTETPNFLLRYNQNFGRTESGYFSVIEQLFNLLYGKFHYLGYEIPNKAYDGKEIRPDVSVGKCFAKHISEKYPAYTNDYKMYMHKFDDIKEFEARQYKNHVWPIFVDYVEKIWIPSKAPDYFNQRDKKALAYLPKLITTGKKSA